MGLAATQRGQQLRHILGRIPNHTNTLAQIGELCGLRLASLDLAFLLVMTYPMKLLRPFSENRLVQLRPLREARTAPARPAGQTSR